MSIDLDFVRSQFPALAGDWTFFDNAGGSQTLAPVMRRIQEYLESSDVQHGASYAVSRLAEERVAAAVAGLAAVIGAAEPAEVVMGPSTTMLLRILSLCLARTMTPGDEVVVTNCDHEANIGPWVDLERSGMIVKTWRVNPETWALDLADLEALMTKRTRLVALTHASNILGGINPIDEIARFVHDRGALICVDGVAYAPHRAVDVRALGVDFYALSCYKVYGPHCALLYGRRDHLLGLPGFNHFFIGADDIPYKFQPGGLNYELTYGMLGLGDYLADFARAHGRTELADDPRGATVFGYDLMSRHEEALAGRLLDFLEAKRGVRIIGPASSDRALRVPTLSFVHDDKRSDEIVTAVDEHGIGIRHGDFYARRLIEDLGLGERGGVLRVSMVHYNTLDEVDRLITVLDDLI
jgi:cysteine desulfurase family protein (TIGR01976 family)